MTLFKESKIMAVKKNLRITINFYKKLYLLVITWKKIFIEASGTNNIHTEKDVFYSCYF